MPDKRKYSQMISDDESKYGFSHGFKLLYCPWKVISEADIAFISLNPGRPPDAAQLQLLSDERGNSYEVEKYTTKSPITEQFLMLCDFLGRKPASILTGVACPYRGDRWTDFSSEQKKVGLNIGKQFWSEALGRRIKLVITLGNETTQLVTDIKSAQLELEINSGWGKYNLRRYRGSQGTEIVQLLHLSTFKLFSRDECTLPLRTIFENIR
jgi:hypothetical protein